MTFRLVRYLVLPPEISRVERQHLARVNRIALIFFLFHFPVFIAVAALCHTGPLLAAKLCALTLVGPVVAYHTLRNPRSISLVLCLTAVFMGGLLVYFGQGPMQIEMHFYFFVLLALMAIFGNPLIIIAAAITVALHHLALYLVLPNGVFNYQASVWTVVVHTLFVVLESIAACFVARSFFDSVMGLEGEVDRRTEEVRSRNNELKLVLDNVGQGLLAADHEGLLTAEHSRTIEDWLGPFTPNERVWEYFNRANQDFGRGLQELWVNFADGILSPDDILSSLPKHLSHRGRELLCEYKAIASTGNILIVVSDVTAQLENQRLEAEQRETVKIFESISADRAGCVEFLSEATALVHDLESETASSAQVYRAVHTLKGNANLFGITSLEQACHTAEEHINREGGLLHGDRGPVIAAWEKSAVRFSRFLGSAAADRISVDELDYAEAISAIRSGVERPQVAQLLEMWRYESASDRLGRIAEQAKGLAKRLGKGPIEVSVHAGRLRLPQAEWSKFWSAFAHVVRNAVDHGLEDPAERVAAGKPAQGSIHLSIERTADQIRLTAADDGRGIQWRNLRTVAAARGLPVETSEDLTEAMFIDGVSTKSEASEISGRGLGMGAIRAACQKMGGILQVTSQAGLGTQLLFLFPLKTLSVAVGASAVARCLSSSGRPLSSVSEHSQDSPPVRNAERIADLA
jgi:two-component system, chemotaxis family, sensor kinase CheA